MKAITVWRKLGLGVFFRNSTAVVGLVFVILVVFLAVFGERISPYPPNMMDLQNINQGMGSEHLLGTDHFGRDLFSRILTGTRRSLAISVMGIAGSVFLGGTLALVGGFLGGWVDLLLSRCIDIMMAIPGLLIAIIVLALTEPSPLAVSLAIAIAYTASTARVIRSSVLSARSQPYVEASLGTGASTIRVMMTDVIPTILPIIVVQATCMLAWGILDEAALGFLGLGVQPPDPSWGSILSESRDYLFIAPWAPLGAGFAVLIAVFGFNLLGDGLRDLFDPRTRER